MRHLMLLLVLLFGSRALADEKQKTKSKSGEEIADGLDKPERFDAYFDSLLKAKQIDVASGKIKEHIDIKLPATIGGIGSLYEPFIEKRLNDESAILRLWYSVPYLRVDPRFPNNPFQDFKAVKTQVAIRGVSMKTQFDNREYQGKMPLVECVGSLKTNLDTLPLLKPVEEEAFNKRLAVWIESRRSERATAENKAISEAASKKAEQLAAATAKLKAEQEQKAVALLNYAKRCKSEGRIDKAKSELADLIKKFPDTAAAKEAKEILDNL